MDGIEELERRNAKAVIDLFIQARDQMAQIFTRYREQGKKDLVQMMLKEAFDREDDGWMDDVARNKDNERCYS